MKIIFFISLFLLPILSFAQRTVVYSKTFDINTSFDEQVKNGMNKHHKKYRTNDFYNYNVNINPLFEGPDSITYNVKIIAASRLWGAKGTFIKTGNSFECHISDIVILKKTSMSGVDYINMQVNDMEETKGNKINLILFEEQLDKFFRGFR